VPMTRPPTLVAAWALVGGVAAATLYVGTVMLASPFPVRVLYDGLVPLPPYRWVHPPPYRSRDNQAALSGSGTIALGPPSRASEVSTEDDQALVTLPQGIISPQSGESMVKVTIVPLDPATVARPPNGRRFDGNAYRIEASYAGSGSAAVLTASPTVVLRYPMHATQMLRAGESGWTSLTGQVFTGSQQVLANTDRLGVFIAAAPMNSGGGNPGAAGTEALAGIVAVAGLIAAGGARSGACCLLAPMDSTGGTTSGHNRL
jgi:hypothetical protein